MSSVTNLSDDHLPGGAKHAELEEEICDQVRPLIDWIDWTDLIDCTLYLHPHVVTCGKV